MMIWNKGNPPATDEGYYWIAADRNEKPFIVHLFKKNRTMYVSMMGVGSEWLWQDYFTNMNYIKWFCKVDEPYPLLHLP